MKKIILVSILVIVLFASSSCNMLRTRSNICIFSDITEFEQIEKDFLEYGTVERYDSPKDDKHLKGLSYVKFYAGKYKCDDFQFEIFAYEFEDSILAEKYYENAVGNETTINPRYVISGNLRNTTLLVIDGANVYLASYSTKYKHNVESFFATKFNKLLYEETEDGLRPADK